MYPSGSIYKRSIWIEASNIILILQILINFFKSDSYIYIGIYVQEKWNLGLLNSRFFCLLLFFSSLWLSMLRRLMMKRRVSIYTYIHTRINHLLLLVSVLFFPFSFFSYCEKRFNVQTLSSKCFRLGPLTLLWMKILYVWT